MADADRPPLRAGSLRRECRKEGLIHGRRRAKRDGATYASSVVDTSEFDAEIARQTTAIGEARDVLTRVFAEFREATITWAQETYQRDIDALITSKPQELKALGPQRLAELKKKLTTLIADAPAIVDEEFGRVNWGHDPDHTVSDHRGYSDNPFRVHSRMPESVDAPLRRIRGRTGPVLAEFGLAGRDWTTTRYPYGIDWTDEMGQAMNAYGEAYDEILGADQTRRDAEHDKAAAEAAELWDDA